MSILTPDEGIQRLRKSGIPIGAGLLFSERAEHITYDWHSHKEHQLLYSFRGRVVLETHASRWILPPEKAAWIPGGVSHSTSLDRAEMISMFFKPTPPTNRAEQLLDIAVFPATPLLRELLLYSSQWINHPDPPELQSSLVKALELLCQKLCRRGLPFRLPFCQDFQVQRVLDFISAHLDSVTLPQAAKATGFSERTLRRRFAPAVGMTWQDYLVRARMLQAMELLLSGKQSILEISLAVGYSSPSAFATVFGTFTGQSPTQFRKPQIGNLTADR